MRDKNLPNFIVAGFPKCGTSSLYHYLKGHPDIYLPEKKELHFFTHQLLAKSEDGPGDKLVNSYHVSDYNSYQQLYSNALNHSLRGDFSPSYASYPECIPTIKETLGDKVKIIIILRDPVSRIYSNYLHLVREDRERLSLDQALEKEEERRQLGYGDFWMYTFNSLYYSKVKSYKEAFDHILIMPFESFISDKNRSLKRIFEFLEIDDSYVPQNLDKKYNEGGVFKKNRVTDFLHGRSKIKDAVKKIIPLDFADIKVRLLSKFRKEPPELSNEVEERLISFFKEDVQKLSTEFDLDISEWRNYR